MAESRGSRTRGSRPKRPSFVEHVTSVSVQDAVHAPSAADALQQAPTGDPASLRNATIGSASPVIPVTGQPRVVESDGANRPTVSTDSTASTLLPAGPRSGGPTSAMWLLVALVMGLAIGAVTGTVAALTVFG